MTVNTLLCSVCKKCCNTLFMRNLPLIQHIFISHSLAMAVLHPHSTITNSIFVIVVQKVLISMFFFTLVCVCVCVCVRACVQKGADR